MNLCGAEKCCARSRGGSLNFGFSFWILPLRLRFLAFDMIGRQCLEYQLIPTDQVSYYLLIIPA